MREFVKHNLQFFFLLAIWAIIPVYAGTMAGMGLVLLSIVLLYSNNSLLEIFLGFIFILILSDSLFEGFEFAKTFKNIYLIILMLIIMVHPGIEFAGNLIKGFIPFMLIAIFALQFSGNISISIQKTISYIIILLITPSYMIYFFREEGPGFLKTMVFFFMFIVAAGYLSKLAFPEFGSIEGGRLRGFFGNPNGLGIFMFLSFIFFYVTHHTFHDLFSRNELRIIFLITFLGLIDAGSRSALVSVLMVILFKQLQQYSALLSLIIFALIIVSYQAITMNIVELVQSVGLDNYFRVNTLKEGSGRFIAWGFAWQKIQNFYYFGGGFGNDEYIMRQNYRELAFLGHQGGVHNSYLTFWFDSGLIGVVMYFFNFLRIFIAGSKLNKMAVPCLYAVLFSITYESWLAGSLNPFTIILFLTASFFVFPELNTLPAGFTPKKKDKDTTVTPVIVNN